MNKDDPPFLDDDKRACESAFHTAQRVRDDMLGRIHGDKPRSGPACSPVAVAAERLMDEIRDLVPNAEWARRRAAEGTTNLQPTVPAQPRRSANATISEMGSKPKSKTPRGHEDALRRMSRAHTAALRALMKYRIAAESLSLDTSSRVRRMPIMGLFCVDGNHTLSVDASSATFLADAKVQAQLKQWAGVTDRKDKGKARIVLL